MDAQSLFDVFDVETFYEKIKRSPAYCPCKLNPGLTIISRGKIIYRSIIADNGETQSQGI